MVIITVFILPAVFLDGRLASFGRGIEQCVSTTLRIAERQDGKLESTARLCRTKQKHAAVSGTSRATPPPAEGAAGEAPRNPNMKWYIIHSYSGFERKVKESLESRVAGLRLAGKDRQGADSDRIGH